MFLFTEDFCHLLWLTYFFPYNGLRISDHSCCPYSLFFQPANIFLELWYLNLGRRFWLLCGKEDLLHRSSRCLLILLHIGLLFSYNIVVFFWASKSSLTPHTHTHTAPPKKFYGKGSCVWFVTGFFLLAVLLNLFPFFSHSWSCFQHRKNVTLSHCSFTFIHLLHPS